MFVTSLTAVHAPSAMTVLRGSAKGISKAGMSRRELRVDLYRSFTLDSRVQGHAFIMALHQSAQGDSLRPGQQRGGVWVRRALSGHSLQTCADPVLMFFRKLCRYSLAHGDGWLPSSRCPSAGGLGAWHRGSGGLGASTGGLGASRRSTGGLERTRARLASFPRA